jgi:pyrroloquinoline quinone biosynthesis protein B
MRTTGLMTLAVALLAASGASCTIPAQDAPMPQTPQLPAVRALGTAQDAGLPHAACHCERCDAARRDPARRRLVASLGLVLPGEEAGAPPRVLLVDVSPDVREQLDRLDDVRDEPNDRADRTPVDGILLTHAHIGHYLGLAFFGFESVNARGIPTWCTPRMAEFLSTNGPWSQLVALGNLDLRRREPGGPVDLGAGVRATPYRVPHRDEYSDTVAWIIAGEARTIMYMPDTEPWRTWDPPLGEVIDEHGVDVLLVDGTFYSAGELPGRPVSSIGHPLIVDTMDLLQERVDAGTLAVHFTHLNHSNPAIDPASEARRAIESRGFRVLDDGDEFALGR